jgi:hypothetical protein
MAWRAACGVLSSVNMSARRAARSAAVRSSSFLARNSSGRSNMRLLIVVSMVKTLSFELSRRPMRSTLVLSADVDGSMYEWQSRIVFGL